jgi:DNA replication and repair protein RecF
VFHVEPGFTDISRKYRRVLRQRNSLLKGGAATPAELGAWDEELALAAEPLIDVRFRYIERLRQVLPVILDAYLPELGEITLQTTPGWNNSLSLIAALREATSTDRLRAAA